MPGAQTITLFDNMRDKGSYLSRPTGCPITVTYDWVSINGRLASLDLMAVRQERKVYLDLNPVSPGPGRAYYPQIRSVEGKLKACVTTGRASAPDSAGGADIKYKPEDRGHVIALELGGVDHPFNIVPQLRFWQQTGDWRKMEREILKLIKTSKADWSHSMQVELEYGRHPANPKYFHVTVRDKAGDVVLTRTMENMPNDYENARQDKLIARLDEKLEKTFAATGGGADDMDVEGADGGGDMAESIIFAGAPAIPPGQIAQQQNADRRSVKRRHLEEDEPPSKRRKR
ncbi:DNA/RNA non-specific endonuclease [Acidimangrovimonas sediminis]|uniref:DNA/RNA non-specific endonuclease n=1 Tax=Acidimangrovimonas sediminis TaxID=2056283 RepID=UPI000C80404C|nr:DNA/RNA non-specific endonuclease [Acidimangrovimonas sediminis]